MPDTPETPEPAVRELIAAGEKASPGPWTAKWLGIPNGCNDESRPNAVVAPLREDPGQNAPEPVVYSPVVADVRGDLPIGESARNAAFIALSRNLAPSLARDWLALRERVTALEAERDAAGARAEAIAVERDYLAARALAALAGAGIATPERTFEAEPHELANCIRALARDRDSWRRKYEALRDERRSVDEGLNSGEGADKP